MVLAAGILLPGGQKAAQSQVAPVPVSLGFHAVHPDMTPEAVAARGVPPGYRVYEVDPVAGQGSDLPRMVLQETPLVRTEDLDEVDAILDARTNDPVVVFRLKRVATRIFARFTRENVGRPFAIVIDGRVLSVPLIRSEIAGGAGLISGNFTVESANALAVRLRAAAGRAKAPAAKEGP